MWVVSGALRGIAALIKLWEPTLPTTNCPGAFLQSVVLFSLQTYILINATVSLSLGKLTLVSLLAEALMFSRLSRSHQTLREEIVATISSEKKKSTIPPAIQKCIILEQVLYLFTGMMKRVMHWKLEYISDDTTVICTGRTSILDYPSVS